MTTPDHPRSHSPEDTLNPSDWEAFRARLHAMLNAAIDKMEHAAEGRVWTPFPEEMKETFSLTETGLPPEEIDATLRALLPYGVGNTHPRFFGWVHGAGTPSNLVADITAAAINANTGGRNHGAIEVERQLVDWCKRLFSFPEGASGLIVSGTSMATIIALKAARDSQLDFQSRADGIGAHHLVGYTSSEAHACIARAFDLLGLGTAALRKIPVTSDHQLDLSLLRAAIAADRAAGLEPFLIAGTCGSVNAGTIDDLSALADVSDAENLWFHVDGAFGALGILSERLRPRLTGLERADSIAFDFHKWLHVNYDAGCILIRSGEAHLRAFSDRPDYLKSADRGLAAGGTWPVELGPELSRGFRALKVWAQIAEHGEEKLGRLITQNCEQAAYLGELVQATPELDLLLPVSMQICCFRYVREGLSAKALNRLNEEIVIQLQLQGIAAPSTTLIDGHTAIRVNITNHRTRRSDLDLLVREIRRIAKEVPGSD
ncbi:pyridoxal-dependent decarboxylase [Hyphomonas sp.]|jgi:glutamate/tyrosine decarboxylase-like PLP-dependent enzyme|uniref:pyridoxal phosphate-dependent decarboxylase family protein n=1 Tax=Hyphomonas sp. TaxID=87 RepID=UPI0032D963E3